VPHQDLQSLVASANVAPVDGCELASAECAGEPDEEERRIPGAADPVGQVSDHSADVTDGGRRGLALGGAVGSTDATENRPDPGVPGGAWQAGLAVTDRDGGSPSGEGGRLQSLSGVGQVEGHRRRVRRQRLQAVAVGELGEVSPVSGVGLPGAWRPGRLGVRGGVGDQTRELGGEVGEGGG